MDENIFINMQFWTQWVDSLLTTSANGQSLRVVSFPASDWSVEQILISYWSLTSDIWTASMSARVINSQTVTCLTHNWDQNLAEHFIDEFLRKPFYNFERSRM